MPKGSSISSIRDTIYSNAGFIESWVLNAERTFDDLWAENARLRDVIKFKDRLIEELGQQVKDLREENDRLKKQLIGEEDSWHSGYRYGRGNPMTHDARRRAEEMVEKLTWLPHRSDIDLCFAAADLICELAGLEKDNE